MEYGLRRYEAIQRLWWLLFLMLCLVITNYSNTYAPISKTAIQLKDLKNIDFWTGLQGIRITLPSGDSPKGGKLDQDISRSDVRRPPAQESKNLGLPQPDNAQKDLLLLINVILFLIRAGVIFLELKLVWLCIQFCGKYLLQFVMGENVTQPGPFRFDVTKTSPEAISPRHLLVARIKRIPLSFVLHPFLRLRLMLSGSQKNVSSEELLEKERRIVETDWQILNSSWGPFRWLFWIIPLLGLVQSAWFLVLQFHIASSSQKEIIDQVQSMPYLLLPLVQAAGIAIFFKIAASVLGRLEDLYLSNLDAFVYDRLLSKLPLGSNDTVLILESLQSQFKDLHAAIRRLERLIDPERRAEKRP
jgi:hypothetical protein